MSNDKTQPKNVNFDFFQVWKIGADKKEVPFDFDDWCENLPASEIKGESNLDKRNIRYSGDIIRCDNIFTESPHKNPVTILHFTKLRDSSRPAVATLSTPELTDVSLKANEYIAEDVSALFDSSNYCLMLQKNIFCLSVSSLADYVNYFWNIGKDEKDYELIQFRPILRKDAFKVGLNAKKINKPELFTISSPSTVSPRYHG
ncbi:DUF6731 family protein, partial [Loigolactobacillus bifermentans]